MTLPNFFLVDEAKSGTTTLHEALRAHPGRPSSSSAANACSSTSTTTYAATATARLAVLGRAR